MQHSELEDHQWQTSNSMGPSAQVLSEWFDYAAKKFMADMKNPYHCPLEHCFELYQWKSYYNSGMISPFITSLDVTNPKLETLDFNGLVLLGNIYGGNHIIYIYIMYYTYIYIYMYIYIYVYDIYIYNIYLFRHDIYYCIFLLFPSLSSNSRIDSSTALGWLFETGFDWYSELACRAQSTSKINAQFFQHISNAGAWATDHHYCDLAVCQNLVPL